MFELTGVDGIMIGRASLGNPWIFKETINYLMGNYNNETETKIPNEEKLRVILKHINLEIQDKGELVAVKEMRKHISWYIKNYKDASKFRDEVNKIDNRNDLEQSLKEYFMSL